MTERRLFTRVEMCHRVAYRSFIHQPADNIERSTDRFFASWDLSSRPS